MDTTPHDSDSKPPRIRRGRVESVDLFEIKEHELELFQKGSPADLHLNFSIFLLSLAFTSIAALATATFQNENVHTTFIVIGVVGVILGAYFLIAWWRNRTPLSLVCKRIRERIKESEVVVSSQKIEIAPSEQSEPGEPSEPKDQPKP